MNREILFRGKKHNNNWVTGYFFKRTFFPCIKFILEDCWQETNIDENDVWLFEESEVMPETVGQYTGIKDKNDKMIFEGDIIKWTNKQGYHTFNKNEVSIIAWFADGQYLGFGFDKDKPLTLKKSQELEIIGNIHDNPELCKE